ncbi:MAG TPA: Asp-tRNA(Asn)/Glu-tRNA(Gln) amidotransferase GatCAB subunit C [Gammaproteobacteria bacterium]|nr:Asp-tRNA(Asn)/Glu-tRNA(Gln) amidotransferase GatCAB subunit C [Gammaproteobacteria bacterium]
MSFDQSEVEKIAHLARLAVSGDEARHLTDDLSRILDLVAVMGEVDTSGVEAMAHPLHMTQRLRADEVTETDQRNQNQKIAPATEAGLYLVPRVIE